MLAGMTITASFDIESWDEQTYDTGLTRGKVVATYHGDIEGTGTWETLMAYADDGSARYVGLERVVGRIAGREGSVVLRQTGEFTGGVASTTLEVVPGSGTGELAGLRGEGGYRAGEGRHVADVALTVTFDGVGPG